MRGSRLLPVALPLALLAGSGCGKRGAPLPPLPVEPAPVDALVVRQAGSRLLVSCPVPPRYTDGERFTPRLVEVRIVPQSAIVWRKEPRRQGADELAPLAPLPLPERIGRGELEAEPPDRIGLGDERGAPGPEDTGPVPAGTREQEEEEGEEEEPEEEGAAASSESSREELEARWRQLARDREAQQLLGRYPDKARAILSRDLASPQGAAELLKAGKLGLDIPLPGAPGEQLVLGLRLVGERKGDRGVWTRPVVVRLAEAEEAPPAPRVANQEQGLGVEWDPGPGSVMLFRGQPGTSAPHLEPVSGAPLDGTSYLDGAPGEGSEACYVVGRVRDAREPVVLTALSEGACATRIDRFPPAAPAGLQGFASGQGVLLTWNASPSGDVAGYRVYRRRGAEEEGELLTREAVRETSYLDSTVEAGVTYWYRVTALDGAALPNESEPGPEAAATAVP